MVTALLHQRLRERKISKAPQISAANLNQEKETLSSEVRTGGFNRPEEERLLNERHLAPLLSGKVVKEKFCGSEGLLTPQEIARKKGRKGGKRIPRGSKRQDSTIS